MEYVKKLDLIGAAVEVEYLGRPRLMVSVARIGNTPSVEIVCCGECRYWHNGECWGIPYRGDYDTSIDTKADDFCSYGEREGE